MNQTAARPPVHNTKIKNIQVLERKKKSQEMSL